MIISKNINVAFVTVFLAVQIFGLNTICNNNKNCFVTASTKASSAASNPTKYQWEQYLLLQSRSQYIRNALIQRGVPLPSATTIPTSTKTQVDWDCALATADHPKSCLYSLDAQENTKVIAPIDTTNWISLSSLIRLRRTDPTKVEPMWHDRYDILSTWFSPKHLYSLYPYLSWKGMVLSLLLDSDWILTSVLTFVIVSGLLVLRPIWEFIILQFVTSTFFWQHWQHWGRFVHAALPLKLLLGQITYKAIARCFGKIKGVLNDYLVTLECQMWEEAIPCTIIEEEKKKSKKNY